MTDINFEEILNNSNILNKNLNINEIYNNLENLKTNYSRENLIQIYNFLLQKAQNPNIIMYIIKLLDEYRDSSTLEHLVNILLFKNIHSDNLQIKEEYNNVRIMSAKAIANLKSTEAISSLLYCLNNKDENYRVRLACADALGRIGDKYAVAPLIDVVNDEDEKSVYVKESAVFALGLIGDTRAIDPLVNILETKQGLINKFSYLKEVALETLIKLGFCNEEKVYRALKHSISDESPQIRINAIEALMESNHPKAIDTIKNCLESDEDEEVKKNAMIALYNMTDRKILDEIISSTKYSDKLKVEAVLILNEYEYNEDSK